MADTLHSMLDEYYQRVGKVAATGDVEVAREHLREAATWLKWMAALVEQERDRADKAESVVMSAIARGDADSEDPRVQDVGLKLKEGLERIKCAEAVVAEAKRQSAAEKDRALANAAVAACRIDEERRRRRKAEDCLNAMRETSDEVHQGPSKAELGKVMRRWVEQARGVLIKFKGERNQLAKACAEGNAIIEDQATQIHKLESRVAELEKTQRQSSRDEHVEERECAYNFIDAQFGQIDMLKKQIADLTAENVRHKNTTTTKQNKPRSNKRARSPPSSSSLRGGAKKQRRSRSRSTSRSRSPLAAE